MVKLGGVIGALLGFTIQLIFTEWIYVNTFADHDLLEGAIVVLAVVSGALVGRALGGRFANRNAKPS